MSKNIEKNIYNSLSFGSIAGNIMGNTNQYISNVSSDDNTINIDEGTSNVFGDNNVVNVYNGISNVSGDNNVVNVYNGTSNVSGDNNVVNIYKDTSSIFIKKDSVLPLPLSQHEKLKEFVFTLSGQLSDLEQNRLEQIQDFLNKFSSNTQLTIEDYEEG